MQTVLARHLCVLLVEKVAIAQNLQVIIGNSNSNSSGTNSNNSNIGSLIQSLSRFT
jgi:hypothetical protein